MTAVMVLRISIRDVCPGVLAHQEVAYRATGGAAQNMSMADMIAIRVKNTDRYPLWYLQGIWWSGGRTGVGREDWPCKCEERSYSQLVLLASMLLVDIWPCCLRLVRMRLSRLTGHLDSDIAA